LLRKKECSVSRSLPIFIIEEIRKIFLALVCDAIKKRLIEIEKEDVSASRYKALS